MNNECTHHIKSPLKNKYILFFSVVFTDLLMGILTALLLEHFFPSSFENMSGLDFDSVGEEFLIAVLFAPLLETFLFQVLPIQLILRYLKSTVLAIMISAVLFALQHNFSWIYMVLIFPSGLIYATYYIYVFKKAGNLRAFLLVCGVHALHNLVVFSVFHIDSLS